MIILTSMYVRLEHALEWTGNTFRWVSMLHYRYHSDSLEHERHHKEADLICQCQNIDSICVCGYSSLEPNHVHKSPETDGECGKKGWDWRENSFGDFDSSVKVSVFYLLYSINSSFKDAVTSLKSTVWSLYIFQWVLYKLSILNRMFNKIITLGKAFSN